MEHESVGQSGKVLLSDTGAAPSAVLLVFLPVWNVGGMLELEQPLNYHTLTLRMKGS